MVVSIFATLFLILAVSQTGFAATEIQSKSPARFVTSEDSLEQLIVFPDISGDLAVNVFCVAQVSSGGEIERNFCFSSEGVDRSFRDAIDAAVGSAEVTPAVVRGESLQTALRYRVIFVRKDSKTIVRVYPNWGSDVVKYGHDYEDPQRITRLKYPSACRSPTWRRGSAMDSIRSGFGKPVVMLIAKLTIGADGRPAGEVNFESAGVVDTRTCRARLREFLESAEYIPGHHDGKPVEATYVSSFGNHEAMELQ